jgi:hypothetical protein
MQAQTTREFLQLVEVIADGRYGAEPVRLGHADWRAHVDLDQL